MKYAFVLKIAVALKRTNAVYELAYAMLMISGPLLALLLTAPASLLSVPLISLLVYLLIDKSLSYAQPRERPSFIHAQASVLGGRTTRLIPLLPPHRVGRHVCKPGSRGCLQKIQLATSLANFSVVNSLIGLGSAAASVVLIRGGA